MAEASQHLSRMESTDSPKSARFFEYDLLRIFATFLVVLGHSRYLSVTTAAGGVGYVLPSLLDDTYRNALFTFSSSLCNWIINFHMPLFFMLSGAVYAIREEKRFDTLCAKKARRLVVPYFFYGLLFMLPVKYLGGFYKTSPLPTVLYCFLSGGDAGHLWFLVALFWVFLAFWGLRRLSRGSLAALLVLSLLVYLLQSKLPVDFALFQKAMGYLLWFSIGFCLHKLRPHMRFLASRKAMLALLCVTTAAMLGAYFFAYEAVLTRTLTMCLWAFSLAYTVALFFPKLARSRAVRYLARNSLYVYLFHDPLEYLVLRLAFHYGWLSTAVGCWVYLFLRVFGVIALSLLFGKIMDVFKAATARLFAPKTALETAPETAPETVAKATLNASADPPQDA